MGTETKDYTVELDYKAAMTHKSKTEEVEISQGHEELRQVQGL